MKLAPILLSGLIFAAVLIGSASFYADIQEVYSPENSTTEAAFSNFTSALNEYYGISDELLNESTNVGGDITDRNLIGDASVLFIPIAGTLAKTPGFFLALVQYSFALLPFTVPAWMQLTIMVVIIITMVSVIVAIALRREEN